MPHPPQFSSDMLTITQLLSASSSHTNGGQYCRPMPSQGSSKKQCVSPAASSQGLWSSGHSSQPASARATSTTSGASHLIAGPAARWQLRPVELPDAQTERRDVQPLRLTGIHVEVGHGNVVDRLAFRQGDPVPAAVLGDQHPSSVPAVFP